MTTFRYKLLVVCPVTSWQQNTNTGRCPATCSVSSPLPGRSVTSWMRSVSRDVIWWRPSLSQCGEQSHGGRWSETLHREYWEQMCRSLSSLIRIKKIDHFHIEIWVIDRSISVRMTNKVWGHRGELRKKNCLTLEIYFFWAEDGVKVSLKVQFLPGSDTLHSVYTDILLPPTGGRELYRIFFHLHINMQVSINAKLQ